MSLATKPEVIQAVARSIKYRALQLNFCIMEDNTVELAKAAIIAYLAATNNPEIWREM